MNEMGQRAILIPLTAVAASRLSRAATGEARRSAGACFSGVSSHRGGLPRLGKGVIDTTA